MLTGTMVGLRVASMTIDIHVRVSEIVSVAAWQGDLERVPHLLAQHHARLILELLAIVVVSSILPTMG